MRLRSVLGLRAPLSREFRLALPRFSIPLSPRFSRLFHYFYFHLPRQSRRTAMSADKHLLLACSPRDCLPTCSPIAGCAPFTFGWSPTRSGIFLIITRKARGKIIRANSTICGFRSRTSRSLEAALTTSFLSRPRSPHTPRMLGACLVGGAGTISYFSQRLEGSAPQTR